MRPSTVARPVRCSVDTDTPNSGAGLMASPVSVSTSDTPSTTMPTTRPAMFRMMTTVWWSYLTLPRRNFMRRSTIGTITPRRLVTPLMKSGALAIRVTPS